MSVQTHPVGTLKEYAPLISDTNFVVSRCSLSCLFFSAVRPSSIYIHASLDLTHQNPNRDIAQLEVTLPRHPVSSILNLRHAIRLRATRVEPHLILAVLNLNTVVAMGVARFSLRAVLLDALQRVVRFMALNAANRRMLSQRWDLNLLCRNRHCIHRLRVGRAFVVAKDFVKRVRCWGNGDVAMLRTFSFTIEVGSARVHLFCTLEHFPT